MLTASELDSLRRGATEASAFVHEQLRKNLALFGESKGLRALI